MSTQIQLDTEAMALRMKIHRAIEFQLDLLYDDAESFGKTASKIFGRGRGKTQLRNLENIANSTQKSSDILDYIKRQTARMREWSNEDFGPELLEYIKTNIALKKKNIVKHFADDLKALNKYESELKEQEVYLQLIRGFIKQFIIHYEWCLEIGK